MRPDLPEAGKSRSYPVLPLLGAVAFPQGTVLLDLDHAASIHAFSCAMRADGLLLLANQRRAVDAPPFWVPIQHRPEDEQPSIDNLGKVGTLAKVIGASRLPQGARVRLRGLERQQVMRYTNESDHFSAEATVLTDTITDMRLAELLTRDIIAELEKSEINEAKAPGIIAEIKRINDYSLVADTVAAAVTLKARDKQRLLEISSVTDRLTWLLALIQAEESLLQTEKRMHVEASRQMFRIV